MAVIHRPHPPGTLAVICSLGFALLASLLLVILPVYASVSQSSSVSQMSSGSSTTETRIETERTQSDTKTLVETNGLSVVFWLAIPVAIAGAAMALNWTSARRPARIVAAVVLVMLVIMTGFSIGLLFGPSALAMLVAAATGGRREAPEVATQP